MTKSLAESAAEILKASIAGAGKDPIVKGPESGTEVGGSTNDNPAGPDNPGAKAAAPISPVAKPAVKGDAKAVKVSAMEETEAESEEELELSEEELEEFLNSLTEEELAELASLEELEEAKKEDDEEDEDEEDEEDKEDEDEDKMKKEEAEPVAEEVEEMTEEQIAEARKAAMKKMVADNMGSCKEDIDALFNGEALSEDFRGKATTIFEAAVRARVESITEKLFAENEEILANAIAEIQEDLTNNVDEYLNHVVEHWMEENQLQIETGLRTEIAEEFMEGLKNLFVEHYMEVPEEKADLVEEMAAKVVAAEEALREQSEKLAETTKALNESKAKEILSKVCEGLTSVQAEKVRALAEGVEFTTEGEYKEKLAVIRENYFPTKAVKSEAPQTVVETVNEGDKGVSNVMDYYVQAISKSLPK